MTTLERTYKQDKKIYIALLIVYGFLAIVLEGIYQDVATAILFLYVLFLMYCWDKISVEQDNRYQAISDVLANTSKLYAESQVKLLATKAELEHYKNHQENTYKLLSSQAKVSTSGGGMGDYAILVVDEFAVVNEARYTFALRGEQYIGYGLPNNKIKALPMNPTVSTPEIPLETIYIAFG
jgi:hypothetical protein